MLEKPGDLIPVNSDAASVPWTRRRSQILDFLHRGPVTFSTLVYDTNVGDISSLGSYFNPERVSVNDLNTKIGCYPSSGDSHVEGKKIGNDNVVMPRLLLYAERIEETVPDFNHPPPGYDFNNPPPGYEMDSGLQNTGVSQRTLNWVMNQKLKARIEMAKEDLSKIKNIGQSTFRGQIGSNIDGKITPYSSEEDKFSLEALSLEMSGGPATSHVRSSCCKLTTEASTEPDLATALDMVSWLLKDRAGKPSTSK